VDKVDPVAALFAPLFSKVDKVDPVAALFAPLFSKVDYEKWKKRI
jgi:hypothetical protein